MNARSVNSAAGVIHAAMQRNQTPAGIAVVLEAAGLLMSPAAAADIAKVSTDAVRVADEAVAELKREHAESARLRARVAELEAELYTEQEQHRTTLKQRNAHAQELLALRGGRAAPYTPNPEAHAQMREGLTRYFAGQETAPEGEHYPSVHHDYRKGRDLPELGGA